MNFIEDEEEENEEDVIFEYIPKIDTEEKDEEKSVYPDFDDEKEDIDF